VASCPRASDLFVQIVEARLYQGVCYPFLLRCALAPVAEWHTSPINNTPPTSQPPFADADEVQATNKRLPRHHASASPLRMIEAVVIRVTGLCLVL
jgi:hypothetical protein